MFALMAVLLMGGMDGSAKTLVYDFTTNHPTTTIRIDQGYKEIRGSFAYWTGTWAGLFGNKIAFDASSAYPCLSSNGGLVDYHDHQKMYILNLSTGDRVRIYYTGNNPAMQFHISSTATFSELTANFDPIESGHSYYVSGAGNMCLLNKWKKNEAETIVTKIEIDTFNDNETVDISNGLCTYCSKNPLDFSSLTSIKAYIVTGYDNGKFIFKQVKYVPSNTGFLIVRDGGSANSATIPIGRSTNYKENVITGNMFIGCLKQTSIAVNDEYKYYEFGKAYGYIACYLMWWDFTCAANKAYIAVKK